MDYEDYKLEKIIDEFAGVRIYKTAAKKELMTNAGERTTRKKLRKARDAGVIQTLTRKKKHRSATEKKTEINSGYMSENIAKQTQTKLRRLKRGLRKRKRPL